MQRQLQVLIAEDLSRRFALRLARVDADDGLDIRLSDIHPRPTTAFRMNLSAWLGRVISDALAELRERASRSL